MPPARPTTRAAGWPRCATPRTAWRSCSSSASAARCGSCRGWASTAVSVIATDWRPEDRLARVAATCTLRLPLQLSNARTADETIRALERTFYPGWQDSPWLSGQLVLELDEEA